MSRQQLTPKNFGAQSTPRIRFLTDLPPPVSSIQVHINAQYSCDSSYSSNEEMNAPAPNNRNCMPRHNGNGNDMLIGDERREEEWATLLHKTPPLAAPIEPIIAAANPFATSPAPTYPTGDGDAPRPHVTSHGESLPKPILRRRLSSSSLTNNSQNAQKRQQLEIQSILSTLEELQHNFVTNDNSASTHNLTPIVKEFAIRHFPNGNLFSGNVDANTGEMIYGRMTCAMEMETYEGPFWREKRHGEGAVCIKMDGGAKFLGRYHEGQMHSGTLIVTRSLPSDFTYTGTFLNHDFHGIGTIVSQNGSIYQGQFACGQYHGVGTLRTVCDADDERGDNNAPTNKNEGKMESVYTGDFSEGLFHGSGTLTHSDGSSYVGTWAEGKRVEGTETLSNGDVFEGKFLNDVRDGQGMLKMKCGQITKVGVWEKDCLKEECELNITFGDGHVYNGDHSNSVPHGFGRMEYADLGYGESAYTGWFVNGVRHGEGRCFFHKIGDEYGGEWACDEPIGLKLFQHNGPLIEGSNGGGEDVVEMIECPPTLLNSSVNAGNSSRPRNLKRSQISSDLNSSLVSAASSGAISCADSDESYALSSIENRANSPNTVPQMRRSLRASTHDSENLSLSMKSLSVFDFHEGLKLYKYLNGDVFKGRLDKANLRQGSGVYTEHRMGSVYNGDWKDSKRHGVGHLKLASGVEYSGEFFDDKIHGQGSLTLIDGTVYTGSFFNGLFHGRGMLEDEGHRRVYFGEFENGERSGEGEEKLSDGSRYKGEYKHGKRNGVGVLFGPDGAELYRGEWDEDIRHGKGVLSRHQQEGSSWEGSYDGDFFQNKFSGNGKYTYTDGTSVEGQWLDDIPRDGDWSIKYPDGSKFYGFATFQHPEEKSIVSDGSSSRGLTAKSRDFLRVPLPHGFGSLTYPSGQRYVGSFVYGEYYDAVTSQIKGSYFH